MSTNVATQKTCARCGQPFTPRSNVAKWCDACCTYTCIQCGKSFTSRRNRQIRFCSVDCTNTWQDSHGAKEAARQRTITLRGSGTAQRCKTCGELFYVPGWRLHRAVKYCSHACRDYPADMKGINRVLRFPARPKANRLEAAGRAILDNLGVAYAEQQVIGGKFVVDVLLGDARTVIQWDGDFWHANPAVYPEATHAIQQVNVRRDRQCDAYLSKCGYRVLRFWESDVHQRPSWVAVEIARALASSAST
jgi:very-short-patch-repair endonuclease